MNHIFTTRPELHADNVNRAALIRAAPGRLAKPDGSTEPAVIIFSGRGLQYALNQAQAYRLADSIANALESHRKP
ncbi:hypothetical protein [Arthrobacter psychrochitiniphilus]|uniref:hypothetical protein n=1 Tax=Arthrobacter psychrochitiniphilus TaxID=291045 RepID=UPI003F7BCEDA